MLNDLYSDALLDAAASIPEKGALQDADASSRKVSKVCGSEVGVDLKLRDGVVADIALDVNACALGQASSSLLARHNRGRAPEELRTLAAKLKREGYNTIGVVSSAPLKRHTGIARGFAGWNQPVSIEGHFGKKTLYIGRRCSGHISYLADLVVFLLVLVLRTRQVPGQ